MRDRTNTRKKIEFKPGHKFGKRTYLGAARYQGPKDNKLYLQCQCECDRIQWVRYDHLRNGKSQECWWCSAKKLTKHGRWDNPTFIAWRNIMRYCNGTHNPNAHIYTLKNIKVCKRWQTYENFLADMGEKPENHRLSRKNKNKDFEPGNCEWIMISRVGLYKYETNRDSL